MDPDLVDLMSRVQTGHTTCIRATEIIEEREDKLLSLIESAANRLETIRETDKTGLVLDADIARLRAALPGTPS